MRRIAHERTRCRWIVSGLFLGIGTASVPSASAQTMQIISVVPTDCGRAAQPDCAFMIVTTTGADYDLLGTGVTMYRWIDPASNSLSPLGVATLSWAGNTGGYRVAVEDAEQVVIDSATGLRFDIRPDSLMLVSSSGRLTAPPGSPFNFSYVHTNLIFIDPALHWAKQNNGGLDRMWTDGYGGSLHAHPKQKESIEAVTPNLVNVTAIGENSTTFTLVNHSHSRMAHMVFPPRLFDFAGLYDATARPVVHHVNLRGELNAVRANATTMRDTAHIGTILLWDSFYTHAVPIVLSPGGGIYEEFFPDENNGGAGDGLDDRDGTPHCADTVAIGDDIQLVPALSQAACASANSNTRVRPGTLIIAPGTNQVIDSVAAATEKKYFNDPLDPTGGYIGYRFKDPTDLSSMDPSRDPALVIDELRRAPGDGGFGFKVILRFQAPTNISRPGDERWGAQSMDDMLAWMERFQNKYNFDGWYFDNADYTGGGNGGWATSYEFIRRLRQQVDAWGASQPTPTKGILFHHDSVDVWGIHSGLRAIMIDAYMDYTRTGETGEIADVEDVNNLFMRYYMSGYGLSQAFGSYKRASKDYPPIYVAEYLRAAGQNLHGAPFTEDFPETGPPDPIRPNFSYLDYLDFFLPAHNIKRSQWPSPTFNPAVTWPVSDWFHRIDPNVLGNISVQLADTSVRVKWTTDALADSSVVYTNERTFYTFSQNQGWVFWKDRDDPDYIQVCGATSDCPLEGHEVFDPALTQTHEAMITGLSPNTEYRFRIRSSNNAPELLNEIRWGHVGTFTTLAQPVAPPAAPPANTEPGFAKCRYLSFLAPGNPGIPTAIRVRRFESSGPVNLGWVGEPVDICETSGTGSPTNGVCPGSDNTTFKAALVQCANQPHIMDWSTVGTVHVYGQRIIPGKSYEIQTIYGGADRSVEANFSQLPLGRVTSVWGDVAQVFDPTATPVWGTPDDDVDLTVDSLAVLEKFRNVLGFTPAPVKVRVDLEPEIPDLRINIGEVTRVLDAFRSKPYPFEPNPCP